MAKKKATAKERAAARKKVKDMGVLKEKKTIKKIAKSIKK